VKFSKNISPYTSKQSQGPVIKVQYNFNTSIILKIFVINF